MHYRITACGVAVAAAMASSAAFAAPTLSWQQPTSGKTVSGTLSSGNCEVIGRNIRSVRFYVDNKSAGSDSSTPWNCNIDTRNYSNGTHYLRAIAYDSAGASTSLTIPINVQNGTSSTPPPAGSSGPTVAFTAPAVGGALSGNVQGPPNCVVTGSNIARVMFYLNDVWTNTDGNLSNGLGCWIDTTKYKDGNYTLKAVAYDSAGRTATATRAIAIKNGTSSGGTTAGPTVAFTAPAVGGVLKGNVQGPPNCVVTGSNIAKVMFYLNDVWTNTDGNLSNGLGCWIDTTKYKDGNYTVKAVAYDAAGRTATATRAIVIKNGTTATNTPPTVAFTAPAAGATVSGDASCAASASDANGIAKVDFYLNNKLIVSDATAPYTCAFNTGALANGTYNLMAIASDKTGLKTSTQRSITVKNTTTTPAPAPSTSISSADIVEWASAAVPFSQQSLYNSQVINTYLPANKIPESGIHGSTLPNGETLRLGKQADPTNSARKALVFQLSPNDPTTSGSHRAEIKFPANIDMNKTYWAAFSVYTYDWGTLPSGENAMFGMQLHAGSYGASLSPAISLIAGKGGRTWWIDARTSTASAPTQSTSYSVRSADQQIQFGRWMDIVVKFKLNTSGNGFVQVWANGTKVMDHKGSLGYNTGSQKPYFKFGYYNWNGFKGTRKVLLREPVVVLDPTGSKYTPEALRKHLAAR